LARRTSTVLPTTFWTRSLSPTAQHSGTRIDTAIGIVPWWKGFESGCRKETRDCWRRRHVEAECAESSAPSPPSWSSPQRPWHAAAPPATDRHNRRGSNCRRGRMCHSRGSTCRLVQEQFPDRREVENAEQPPPSRNPP